MRRLFLTVQGKKCAFGCTYCFADFSQYEGVPSLEEVERGVVSMEGVDVVYPACDVDLFAMRGRWADVMERAVDLDRSISISTKAKLTSEQVNALSDWARGLRARELKLKVGISASTMSRCEEIEPRAASWPQRIENLGALREAGVDSNLVLRPLLPEIADSEYLFMLRQASQQTATVVIGEEYLDEDVEVRRASGEIGVVHPRTVNWLAGEPIWPVRGSEDRARALACRAQRWGMRVYLSDAQLMADLSVRARERSERTAGR